MEGSRIIIEQDMKPLYCAPGQRIVERSREERMRLALIDIHNQTCIAPDNLEIARTTQECIEEILNRVKDLYAST